jgi:hypothetical protein
MESNENLLTELHRWARRQDENFTTESFAHLLKRLVKDVPDQIPSLMERLTGIKAEWNNVQIDTQVHTRFGTPDLSIITPAMTIYVEVKVEAELADGQAEGYLSALEDLPESAEVTQLALLTKYPAPQTVAASVHRARWYEIIDELETLQKCELPEVAAYLLRQFVDFLVNRGMAIPRVRSEISGGVREYISRVGDDSIFESGSKRPTPDRLHEEKELQPLSDLLSMMNNAIDSSGCCEESIRFGSGQWKGVDWLGWNIDAMQHFFYIRISSPDVLVFQSYLAPTNPEKKESLIGRLYEEDGRWQWENELDLVKSRFFALEKDEQVSTLVNFVQDSYKIATAMQ